MIAEAEGEAELSAGMTSFATRAARALNKALCRRGRVWADRYHARPLTSPRDVRNTLVYVLMNFAKHHATHQVQSVKPLQHGGLEWFIARYAAHLHRRTFGVDPCSSAPYFNGFAGEPDEQRHIWATRETPPVHAARTWLLSTGWRKHGLVPRNVA